MTPTGAALVLAWACIVVLTLATAGLLRRVDALERRLVSGGTDAGGVPDGVRAGLRLPVARYLGNVANGERDLLVLVVSPSCGSCREALAQLAAASPDHLHVTVATTAATLEPLDLPAGFVPLTDARELVDVLGVPATPYLVRLDADGTIRRAGVVASSTNLALWTAPRPPLPAFTR